MGSCCDLFWHFHDVYLYSLITQSCLCVSQTSSSLTLIWVWCIYTPHSPLRLSNTGTLDLPDMYAWSLRAASSQVLGIHIRQIPYAHVTTITYTLHYAYEWLLLYHLCLLWWMLITCFVIKAMPTYSIKSRYHIKRIESCSFLFICNHYSLSPECLIYMYIYVARGTHKIIIVLLLIRPCIKKWLMYIYLC